MSTRSGSYVLVDPRPIAAGAPYTFFLPSEEELAAITCGDLVKLTFEYVPPGEKWEAERMWVSVTAAGEDGMAGVLESEPDDPAATVHMGEEVSFQTHNVLAIVWSDPSRGPKVESAREYWERCMVDDCVLYENVPVGYIYREEPDLGQEGDQFPDSGWRIRGRLDGISEEELATRKASYVAIGAVLNRDDSWLQFVDAPIGTALERDFVRDAYAPVED